MDEEKKQASPEQQIPQEHTPPIAPAEVPKEVQQEPQQIAAPITPAPTQVYVPRKTAAAEAKPSKLQKLKDFVVECKRVLRVTKKPDKMEFKTIVKISGIGIGVIGLIGFVVTLVKSLMF